MVASLGSKKKMARRRGARKGRGVGRASPQMTLKSGEEYKAVTGVKATISSRRRVKIRRVDDAAELKRVTNQRPKGDKKSVGHGQHEDSGGRGVRRTTGRDYVWEASK